MAKGTLSGADYTLIQGFQSIPDVGIYVTPKVEIVSGTISAIPVKYPTVQVTVTFNGVTTGVKVGQMVEILDGSSPVSYGIVRKAVSGSTLFISETPLGAFGFPANIETAIAVGNTIRIYSHHPMWSLNSRIASKTFFKYWDLAYNDDTARRMPVANAGAWQAKKLASGETTARFTLPKGGENISFAVGASSVSAFDWVLPTGVTLVSGYTLNDDVIEVDAEAGSHLVTLDLTNNGRTHTAYVWLFVDNGSLSATADFAIAINSDNQRRMGRVIELEIYGADISETFFRGAGLLLREYPDYNGSELSEGVGIDTFIGYIAEINFNHTGSIPSARVLIESPMIYAERIGQPSQSLTEDGSTSNWNTCDSLYSHPRGFAFYLIKWTCPALLDMHDLDIPYAYESYRRKYMEVNSKNLQGNLQVIADYLTGTIGSASDGTTVMRKNPLYMSNNDRNAIESVWTIQEQDIKPPFAYFRRLYNEFSDVRGGGFSFTGNKPSAFYVGRRWGQGSNSTEMPNFVTTVSEGVSRAKEIIGHYTAEQNAEIQEIGVDLTRNQDVIDPAYMLWYRLTVSADFDPYAAGFSNTRLLATEINRDWEVDEGGLKKRLTIIGQVETFGQEGEQLPIGKATGISQGGWSIGIPAFWYPDFSSGMFSGGQSVTLALVLNNTGELAISFNYLSTNPDWNVLLAQQISDFDFDYNSAFFTSGRDANQALGLWAVVLSSDEGNIYYFDDILRGNNVTLVETVTLADDTGTTNARIKHSETYPDLVIAAFKDGTGTRYTRSTNGGTTWGALIRVGDAITDSEDNNNAPIGLAVFGQYQFVTAPNSAPIYGIYRATTAGGAFSKMTASQDGIYPSPMLAEAIEANGYLYAVSFDGEAYLNNFDGSDYFSFNGDTDLGGVDPFWWYTTGNGSNWSSDGVVTPGNGGLGHSHKFSATTLSGNVDQRSLFLQFHWGNLAAIDCVDISFDVMYASTTTTNTFTVVFDASSSLTAIGQNQWHHIRASDAPDFDFSLGASNVTAFKMLVNTELGAAEIWLDNITLYLGDGHKLWRVEDATGTPNWVNISPAASQAPDSPFDFAVDRVNPDILNTVSRANHNWYKSTNSGDSWSTEEVSSLYRAFYTVGDSILIGGDEIVNLSLNNGNTFTDIEGNLENTFGGDISRIKKVLAL